MATSTWCNQISTDCSIYRSLLLRSGHPKGSQIFWKAFCPIWACKFIRSFAIFCYLLLQTVFGLVCCSVSFWHCCVLAFNVAKLDLFSVHHMNATRAFWKPSSFFYNPFMLLFILTSFFLPFKSFLVCICSVIPIPWPKASTCQIHWCSWSACLASSALCRGRHRHRSPWARVQSWSRRTVPKGMGWPLSRTPAPCLLGTTQAGTGQMQLLPCLPPAAADDAREGKAAKHGSSELRREMDVVLLSSLE